MRQYWITLLLVFSLAWQSLANAGYGVVTAHQEQEQHEQLHFQGVSHHHDEHAEDFHEDDSVLSLVHMISDACHCSPALLVSQDIPAGPLSAGRPVIEPDRAMAWLLPDPLDRPPKRQA